MNITYLRHCESTFNVDPLNDEYDCDLSPNGKIHASQLTGYYDVVICSSLKRAQKTLELSEIKYDKIFVTDLCREVRIDLCDFKQNENIYFEDDEQIELRIKEFKEFIKNNVNQNETCLIISHSDFLKHMTNKDFDNGESFNASN